MFIHDDNDWFVPSQAGCRFWLSVSRSIDAVLFAFQHVDEIV